MDIKRSIKSYKDYLTSVVSDLDLSKVELKELGYEIKRAFVPSPSLVTDTKRSCGVSTHYSQKEMMYNLENCEIEKITNIDTVVLLHSKTTKDKKINLWAIVGQTYVWMQHDDGLNLTMHNVVVRSAFNTATPANIMKKDIGEINIQHYKPIFFDTKLGHTEQGLIDKFKI
jgi:hypothetical protein